MSISTKINAIILAAVIIASGIWLGILYSKINKLELSVSEKEKTILEEEKIIAQANAYIDIQNQKIEDFKIDINKTAEKFKAEQKQITDRYEYLLEKAKEKQKKDPSCENTLNLIQSSQKEFLYE